MAINGRLLGKVAIVTGAGQGVGRGIALALANEGAAVAIADLNQGNAARVAEEVAARGVAVIASSCDVRRRQDVVDFVEETVRCLGAPDVLVNNACTAVTDVALVDLSDDDIALAWESGVLGTFYFLQTCWPHLRGRDTSVINLGSIAGPLGLAGCGAYGPAKEAVRSLTKVAAREWGPDRIRVNAICPNANSPSRQKWRDAHPALADSLEIEHVPLGRIGDCELDVGRAAVFLASNDSCYVTGHTLMVDGGSCAW